jgi:hypothetical protein
MTTEAEILSASILIVDDLPFNVSVLDRMLKNAGYLSITSITNSVEVCGVPLKFKNCENGLHSHQLINMR